MKKLQNKVLMLPLALILVIAMVLPVSSFISEYNEDQPIVTLYDGVYPASSASVWLNGGKRNLPIGASVDSKIKQLTLYEYFDGEMYDISGAKNVKWIATPIPANGQITPPVDFKAAKSENCAVAVTKGKVTAKNPGTALVMAIKANNEGRIVAWEYCTFEVFVGPTKLELKDANKNSIKNLSIGLGETANVYLSTTAKTDVDPNEVYHFEFDKDGSEYAGFNYYGSTFALTQRMIEDYPIPIYAKALKDNKITKVTMLVTAVNSGKTAKFSITIDNKVANTVNGKIPVQMSYSDTENVTYVVDADAMNSYVSSSAIYNGLMDYTDLPITDKPKVFITDTDPSLTNIIDAKGNVKIQGKSGSGLTAKIDASNNLTFTLKKATATMPSTKAYVVVSYNNLVRFDRPVGTLMFEVYISGINIVKN